MSELTEALRTHGRQHRGTDLGGLLQWAALHIESQDDALSETREELTEEENERIRLEGALHAARVAIESALAVVNKPLCPPIELGRDMAPHINLMAGHGDPDYLRPNGLSVRHVDLREKAPRGKKATNEAAL